MRSWLTSLDLHYPWDVLMFQAFLEEDFDDDLPNRCFPAGVKRWFP